MAGREETARALWYAAPGRAEGSGALARAWSDALRSARGERAVADGFARRIAAARGSGVDRGEVVRPGTRALELRRDA